MDSLPYLVSRQVIENVLICGVWHCIDVHQGQRCKCVQEFEWVVPRIGKLHMQMNIAGLWFCIRWLGNLGLCQRRLKSM